MPDVRIPRGWFVVEGVPLPVLELDATVHTYKSADTFAATLALSALPREFDEAYWAAQTRIPCEVVLTHGGVRKRLIAGTADQIEIGFHDRRIRVNGRDRAAGLIEAKTTEKFQNRTASEIASDIAARHGLKADVTATTQKVGAYYDIDHARLTDRDTEWNLLSALAEREGFVCFVSGDTLTFKAGADQSLPVYPITYVPPSLESHARGDFTTLRVVRNLTLSRKVKTVVRSWNTKRKEAVRSERDLSGDGSDQPLVYEYRLPGLSQEQADKIAEQRLAENTRHEISIQIDAPGDLAIDPRMKLALSGTGTALDQAYFIDSIEHRLGEGHRMTVTAKNRSEKRR